MYTRYPVGSCLSLTLISLHLHNPLASCILTVQESGSLEAHHYPCPLPLLLLSLLLLVVYTYSRPLHGEPSSKTRDAALLFSTSLFLLLLQLPEPSFSSGRRRQGVIVRRGDGDLYFIQHAVLLASIQV